MRLSLETMMHCRTDFDRPKKVYFCPDDDGLLCPQGCDDCCGSEECQRCRIDSLKKYVSEINSSPMVYWP